MKDVSVSKLLGAVVLGVILFLVPTLPDFAQPAPHSSAWILTGMVLTEGREATNAVVKVRNSKSQKEYASQPTDAEGIYRIEGVEEGSYNLSVSARDGDPDLKYNFYVYLEAGKTVDLSFEMLPSGKLEAVGNNPPLYLAVLRGRKELAERLIAKGADLNAKNTDGQTPLHCAVQGDKDLAEMLIVKGADVNAKDEDGWTPLHYAVEGDRHNSNKVETAIVEMLIVKGADVNAKDKDGRTPLLMILAQDIGKYGIDEETAGVLAEVADVKTKDEEGRTSLHLVAYHDLKDLALLLIDKGADMNAKDLSGGTPLHTATVEDSLEVAKVLIVKGADVNAKDNGGRTPLFMILEEKKYYVHEKMAGVLAEVADVKAKDKEGRTSLHRIAYHDLKDLALQLIDKGADVNAQDIYGRTPLHAAAAENSLEVAEVLIVKGARVKAKAKDGSTPLSLATDGKNNDMVGLLKKYGAK